MKHITTYTNNKRTSTQTLLQQIYAAMAEGETEFEIDAAGQHDIGGPLWDPDGRTLKFVVRNPGQRVGSMGMPGTEILVEGPAPADVGWLNAGRPWSSGATAATPPVTAWQTGSFTSAGGRARGPDR